MGVSHTDSKGWEGRLCSHTASLRRSHLKAVLAQDTLLCASGTTLSLAPGPSFFLLWKKPSITQFLPLPLLPFHLSCPSCGAYTHLLNLLPALENPLSGYSRKSASFFAMSLLPFHSVITPIFVSPLSLILTLVFLFLSPLSPLFLFHPFHSIEELRNTWRVAD